MEAEFRKVGKIGLRENGSVLKYVKDWHREYG